MNRSIFLKRIIHFHPKLILPIAFSLGCTMALANRFPPAYFLFAICLLWSMGLWFSSDYLLNAKVKSQKYPAKRSRLSAEEIAAIMRTKRRKYLSQLWGGCASIAVLALGCFAITAQWNYEWELEQNFGLLTPAHDPMPAKYGCANAGYPFIDAPLSALRIYAGGGLYWSRDRSLVLISIANKSMISVALDKGELLVSGDIYSPDGDVVHIERNRFETESSVKSERPDRHTLIVLDKWRREILYLRFLNDHAIRLRGIFWLPSYRAPLVVTDDEMIASSGNVTISPPCMANIGKGPVIYVR